MYKSFKYIAVAAIVAACQPKPIDVKVKPAPEKLVVSSSVIPNRIMVVTLTRSFSALDATANAGTVTESQLQSLLVKNAFVTISYGGRIDTLHKMSDGVYGSSDVLLTNYSSYLLYARDNDSGLEVTATTSMMPYKTFDTINVFKTEKGVCNVHFKISDDLANTNYYVVNFIHKLKGDSNRGLQQFYTNSNSDYENYMDLLNDDSFTDAVYESTKELPSVGPNDSIAVSIANISQGYYEFLSAFKRAGNFINALTAEPIHYPTNVNNGYGFFNAYYPQVRVFDMKDH